MNQETASVLNGSFMGLQDHKIEVNRTTYTINMRGVKEFLEQCESFMPIDGNEFEIMTQSIADSIIDYAQPDSTVKQLRPQLKFLRELGFLLKGLVLTEE